MFDWLCSRMYLLVYGKLNPYVLRRVLIPNLNLLGSCLFSNIFLLVQPELKL